MAKDRARDDRRTVGSFDKMRGALGRATGSISFEEQGARKTYNEPKAKGARFSSVIPGQGHIKTGRATTDVYTGETKVYSSKSSSEREGTAGVSNRVDKSNRGRPRNLNDDTDFDNPTMPWRNK